MRYGKFLAQVVAAVLVAVAPFLASPDAMGPSQWVNVVIVALGAVAVFIPENTAAAPAAKMAMAAIMGALVVAHDIILTANDQFVFTSVDWIQVVLALLAPVAVYATPNKNARKV